MMGDYSNLVVKCELLSGTEQLAGFRTMGQTDDDCRKYKGRRYPEWRKSGGASGSGRRLEPKKKGYEAAGGEVWLPDHR